VRTLRVLLVEDDEDHVFLIRRALADLAGVAVAVEVAADGEQALERLARARFEAGGLPQLVLLDLKMPRMGGLEVLGHLRADEITRDLPVVVLTSSEHREDREEALRLGRPGSCASRPTAAASAPRSSSSPTTGPGSRPDA
jgi:CheY-like chemotaxis protein